MQRSWKRRRRDHGVAAARLEEIQLFVPANLAFYARAPVKIEQVRTAAEQHMLAIVDNLAGARMLVRRGASAEIRTPLEERYAKPGFRQGATRGQTG